MQAATSCAVLHSAMAEGIHDTQAMAVLRRVCTAQEMAHAVQEVDSRSQCDGWCNEK
jgi:hypothetical protein